MHTVRHKKVSRKNTQFGPRLILTGTRTNKVKKDLRKKRIEVNHPMCAVKREWVHIDPNRTATITRSIPSITIPALSFRERILGIKVMTADTLCTRGRAVVDSIRVLSFAATYAVSLFVGVILIAGGVCGMLLLPIIVYQVLSGT